MNVEIPPPPSGWIWAVVSGALGLGATSAAGLVWWALKLKAGTTFEPAKNRDKKLEELKGLGKELFAPLLTHEEKEAEVLDITAGHYPTTEEFRHLSDVVEQLKAQNLLLSAQIGTLAEMAKDQQRTSREAAQALTRIDGKVEIIVAVWETAWELKHGTPPPKRAFRSGDVPGGFGCSCQVSGTQQDPSAVV